MKIKDSKLYGIVFSIYVGSGPIYWIPGIAIAVTDAVKITLFSVIVLWPMLRVGSLNRFQFPGGKVVFSLFATFFLLSIPSMLYGDLAASIYKLQNTFQIFLFLCSCEFLIRKRMINFVTYLSVRIFIFFSIFSLFLMLIIPGYINPLNEGLYLTQTGLGGSRTGWSPSIALFLPWLYAGFIVLSGYWVWVAAFGMIANQVLVAGRTGMTAALVSFLLYGLFRKSIKIFLLVVIAIAFIGFLAINNLELLRLDIGSFSSRANLDELSTGRIETYLGALSEIADSPFIGVGPGIGEFSGTHNVVLRAAVEGGIPYALSIVGLLAVALHRGWRGLAKKNWFVVSAFMTVLSGIINSLFEPVAMLGSFNNASFWWLCFAICVSADQSKLYKNIRTIG